MTRLTKMVLAGVGSLLAAWATLYIYNGLNRPEGWDIPIVPFKSTTVDYLAHHVDEFEGQRMMVSGRISVAFEAQYLQPPQYPLSTQLSEERLALALTDEQYDEFRHLHGELVLVIGTLVDENIILHFGTLRDIEVVEPIIDSN